MVANPRPGGAKRARGTLAPPCGPGQGNLGPKGAWGEQTIETRTKIEDSLAAMADDFKEDQFAYIRTHPTTNARARGTLAQASEPAPSQEGDTLPASGGGPANLGGRPPRLGKLFRERLYARTVEYLTESGSASRGK